MKTKPESNTNTGNGSHIKNKINVRNNGNNETIRSNDGSDIKAFRTATLRMQITVLTILLIKIEEGS